MAFSMKFYLTLALLIASSICQLAVTESVQESPETKSLDNTGGDSTLTFVPKYVKLLDGVELGKFKASPSVSFVYYYKQAVNGLDSIFKEYDKSAGYLNAYGLSLGLVDCSGSLTDETLKTACDEADSTQIYGYRQDTVLLALGLDSMFDVNSIMSNVLQLALLDEVLIVQTKKNREEMEHDNSGQTDIIYSYHNAIGTYEHRVFMEIAYAYQDKYKFVVSTEQSTIVGLQDAELVSENSVVAMWVLYCREKYSAATGCRSVNYRGEFNLLSLATFFRQLNWPKVAEFKADSNQCEEAQETPCIYIFHSEATKDKVQEVVDSLQFDVHGMAGLFVQQMELMDGQTDPQLDIAKIGGEQVAFKQDWTLENIEAFISFHIFSVSDKEHEEVTMETEGNNESIDSIDDMVVHVAYEMRRTIGKAPTIPALTDKTFYPTVTGRKLTIVLFYITFDSQSMLFLGPYQEAKQATLKEGEDPSAHPLMRMDCFDWTDICAKENITTYPMIYIYRDGGKRQQYRHAFDKDVLARTVSLLQAEQPLMLKNEEEVEAFVKGRFPDDRHQMVDNLVLLNPSKSQKEVKAFKEAARALETQMLFAIVSPGVNAKTHPVGSVLHVRLNDEYQPTETLSENLNAQSIQDFLLKGQFNLLPELTHLNFPALYARKQPFGILFYESGSEDASSQLLTIGNIIKTNKAPGIIFCKMSMTGNKVAEAILANYTQEPIVPSFAVVNHQKGQVYVLQGADVLSDGMLLPWIQDVQDGSLPPTKVLEKGVWKPSGRHYNFLALMDKDKAKKKKQMRDDEEFDYGAIDESDDSKKGEEESDSDIRSTLLGLQQSRLYSGKSHKAATMPSMGSTKGDEKVVRHTEL
ncbi:thioredoxin domain-containing protein 16-like [Littorina saxatilis]|uniref:Thioredoxin domain-containing protein n=1 Tax=Littorina saxatilis TaxID=31220 RepID=A0AAN9GFF3_9CAEN